MPVVQKKDFLSLQTRIMLKVHQRRHTLQERENKSCGQNLVASQGRMMDTTISRAVVLVAQRIWPQQQRVLKRNVADHPLMQGRGYQRTLLNTDRSITLTYNSLLHSLRSIWWNQPTNGQPQKVQVLEHTKTGHHLM